MRLGVGSGLLGLAGVHLRTDPASVGTPVLLSDDHGDVAFYGLPYLEPALVGDVFGVERARHETVLGAAMDRVRADLARRPAGTRSVVLAHAFVTGGRTSDSERDITVGEWPRSPRRCSTVSTTPPSAISTAASGSVNASATPARRCPTRSPRPTTARACGSWTSARTAR